MTQANFGEGAGMIWLTNVTCTENERVLMNCTADFSGSNTCTHAQDAGVMCSTGNQLVCMSACLGMYVCILRLAKSVDCKCLLKMKLWYRLKQDLIQGCSS